MMNEESQNNFDVIFSTKTNKCRLDVLKVINDYYRKMSKKKNNATALRGVLHVLADILNDIAEVTAENNKIPRKQIADDLFEDLRYICDEISKAHIEYAKMH